MRRVAIGAVIASILIAGYLGVQYREMGGPGDELEYFEQAARLIPFVHNYYGPGYFFALRLVHMALPLDWFSAGKVVALLSLGAFLMACNALFGRILGERGRWLALLILAVNPQVLYGGYEVTNNMYAAAFLIAGIWMTTRTGVNDYRGWLLAGLLFGFAYLTRFSSAGYLLGALAGVWLLQAPLKDKARVTALIAAGAAVPALGWALFLHAVQGFVPANFNFIHLTVALGRFQSFSEMDQLAREYGSLWGVIRSDHTVPLRLMALGVKEIIKFPFTMGFKIYFVLAGLLIPGLLIAVARRNMQAPWLLSFLAGLFLTGLAARGWGHYYVPIIPFGVLLIVLAFEQLSQPWGATARRLIAASLVAVVAGWTVVDTAQSFATRNWAEFGVARRYLEQRLVPGKDVVSSTAASLIYGSALTFVDHSKITTPDDPVGLVDRLRQHGVTYLVISERHTLFEFPELRSLLDAVPRNVPDGLQRDTLITTPRRLAIYKVLPATGGKENR
jgi:hypothetical protein